MRKFLSVLLLSLCSFGVFAGEAKDMAEDPVLEKRMIGLAEKLRCLVCQNESLASSHAELAEDLRREVREQMRKGLDDEQIIEYLVGRYGDFVLYDPPMKTKTLVLWYGPFALLVIGGIFLVIRLRSRKSEIEQAQPQLSEAEMQRAAALLDEKSEATK